jgi:hypothetical protein
MSTDQGGNAAAFAKWDYLTGAGARRHSSMIGAAIGWLFRAMVGIVGGATVGLLIAAFSHPLIGAAAGLLVMIGAMVPRGYGLWTGRCPHCARPVVIPAGRGQLKPFNCPICTKRVLLENGHFVAV